ncbi:MAG: MBL fold metallo-hydrolase [Candidatus Eisenbacteria sp.]|nr:MBL fold metallo-hydrolase [Candidatus Eisenbacteria bacterium]
MRITFWGAARAVTGSRHLLQVNGTQILLDCGLVQGRRLEAEARNRRFPFDPTSIQSVILSHAHMDHSGNLPGLVKNGFRGNIHTTRATAALLDPMLRDSAHIQERDFHYVNKRRSRMKKKPIESIYALRHVEQTLPLLVHHSYDVGFNVADGVTAHFYDAGHILGSALTVLDLEENKRRLRLCFTGDLGRPNLPIIRDPQTVPDIDALIMESTYGNRLHEEAKQVSGIMEELLNRAHQRRGKIIIPSFAVGRTQEIVTVLKELFESGRVPQMPVYVDSPLAVNVTDVFRVHEECFDKETLALLHQEETDPFGFKLMHYVRSLEESKSLNAKEGPMVIISASGMCEAGRILHHLRNNISKPETLILIVGFQAENTLGRKLAEQQKEIRIFGEPHTRRAEVHVIDAFSAHADRDELLAWVRTLKRRPRRIFVVHGEESQALSFAESLGQEGFKQVAVPELGQSFDL